VTFAVRPSTPADGPAIAALLVERGMLDDHPDPHYLNWKYWQPRADWPRPRSFVLAAGNELIAHAAVIPAVCAWDSRRVTMLHMIDWVARSDSVGGITILKHVAGLSDALIGIGGGKKTTRRLLPHLGFRPAGSATGFARPLAPLRLLQGGATWRLPTRLARAIWRRSAAQAPEHWRARRLAVDELNQIASVSPRPGHGLAVTERSEGLFRYILSCPAVPMQIYAVENANRVRGYFLLASVPGQVRIADCWMDSDEPAEWGALILCAVAQAQLDPQAAEVVAWASDALLAGALRSCGFYARFEAPIHVRPSIAEAMPPGTLRVQMLDNDDAFLCSRRQYWG
jgi:hypothetical protein